MRNAIIIMCGVGVVSACSPAPICNDDIYINKWETPIDECRSVSNPVRHYRDRDDNTYTHVVKEPKKEEPKKEEHKEDRKDKKHKKHKKHKRDNSDANGKGGNKHDREDHTKNGTETAENKK